MRAEPEGGNRTFEVPARHAPDFVALCGGDGTVRYVSPSAEGALGHAPGGRVGKRFFEFVHPDDVSKARRAFDRVRQDTGPSTTAASVRVRQRDGSWHHVRFRCAGLLGDSGARAVLLVLRDASRREDTGESPGRRERQFRAVLRRSTEIFKILDPDGTLRYANPAFGRVLGYDPGESVGMNVLEHVHPEDLPKVLEETERTMAEPGVGGGAVEYRFRHADGSWRWIEGVGTYLLDDPDVRGMVVNARDVTRRREAEEARRRQEEYMGALNETALGLMDRLEPEELLRSILSRAGALAGTQHGFVNLLSADGNALVARAGIGRFAAIEGERIGTGVGLAGRVLRSGRPLAVGDYSSWSGRRKDVDEPPYAALGVPLLSGSEVVGSLFLAYLEEGRRFGEEEVEVLSRFAELASVALDNARLFASARRELAEREKAEAALRRSEERYRAVVEEQTDLVCRFSTDLTLTFVNEAYCRFFSKGVEELIGTDALLNLRYEDRAWYEEHLMALTQEQPTGMAEFGILAPGGRLRWQQWSDRAIFEEGGRLVEYQSVGRDVTERRRAEEALVRSETALAEAQRIARLGSWGRDLRTGESWWSDETYRVYGFDPQKEGSPPSLERLLAVVHPDDKTLLKSNVERALNGHKPYVFEHRVVRPDGEIRWVHRQARIERSDGGRPSRMVGTVHDVTERRSLEERLRYQAFHDPLTDLPNRQLLEDRLGQALRRVARKGGARSNEVGVLFMDLDDFKVVNDSLGHEAGDVLLVAVGERLRRCLRPEDTLARFGGDEFVLLVEEVGGPRDAARVAERVVGELRRPFALGDRSITVSASIGIALGSARTKTPEDLLRDADSAMYRAKEEGLRYRVFDPSLYERTVRRLERESALRRAVQDRKIVAHYQPIVDLSSGEVVGVETLARWNHKERELLGPQEFVPLAEETGLIVPIGTDILKQACRQAKEWQEETRRIPPLNVSVNLSAKQLRDRTLVDTVRGVLRETGLEPRCLTLDITETVYVEGSEGNTAILNELRKEGVGISIDDFGMGYSSLSYLKRLPADALKLDRSFVSGVGVDIEDTAIAAMAIDLAHTLGMEVIAEGVESTEQAAHLREMGCDKAQGFHFSGPLSPEAASKYLIS